MTIVSLSDGNCTEDLDNILLAGSNLQKKRILCTHRLFPVPFRSSIALEKTTLTSSFGALIPPSDVFMNYVLELEAIFMMEFERNISKTNIGKYILSKLPTFSSFQCSSFPSQYLLKLFLRMQIHYALKFGNRELYSAKKKDRKYLKVCHL